MRLARAEDSSCMASSNYATAPTYYNTASLDKLYMHCSELVAIVGGCHMVFTEEQVLLAKPDTTETSVLEAWYMDDGEEDQRLPHRCAPNRPVSTEILQKLGVVSWKLDPAMWENDPKLEAIRRVRNFNYQDLIDISKDTLPGYDEKLKIFYQEHMHADEEIRYILAGTGYFDVRDEDDRWIRISAAPGTMIVLPEGIYHRFTLDESNYLKALRLFVGDPVWTPLNRPQEEHASRHKYVSSLDVAAARVPW